MEPMRATSWITRWVTAGLAIVGTGAIAPNALAQIVPDNTLPSPSITDPGCTVCNIDGGTQQGNNLFHSFSEFSVPTGGAAIFNNLETIETIFSRVTGNSVSDIDGLLRTNGTASLFLLNPNGIILGPNARLDIGGSFAASTADSLIFANGEEFSAVDPAAPPLLTVNITPGLQYGTRASANQATLTSRGNLVTGQDLTLMAAQIDVQGQLEAGGNLRLTATGQVRLRDSSSQPLIIAANDELQIRGDQTIDIFALNHPESGLFSGGDLILQSENAVLGDARYGSGGSFRIATSNGDLGNLTSPRDPIIRALGDVTFDTYLGSSLHILAGGSVDVGTITITQPETGVVAEGFLQDTFQLSNGTVVAIDGSAQPTLDIRAGVSPEAIATIGVTGVDPGADIFLNGPTLSPTASRADITVGDVVIPAPDGLVVLTNQYQPNTSLAGGDITITGAGFLGSGIDLQGIDQPGGNVIVDARNSLAIESVIESSATLADAGDITLLAEGDIALAAGSRIAANGLSGGNILLQSGGTLAAADNSLIDSSSSGITPSASQGSITLVADSVELFGEQTAAIALTTGGRAGSPVVIRANDTVTLDGSSIFTFSDDAATGSSGGVTITTQTLNLLRGGMVSSFTTGAGNAGNITVTATDSLTLDGVSQNDFPSSLASDADLGSQGDAGNVLITTPQLTMTNGASLSTASLGLGNAGNVTIAAAAIVLDSSSTQTRQNPSTNIFTTSRGGEGGDIQMTGRTLAVTNGARLFATTDIVGQGNAGDITLNLTDAIAIAGTAPAGGPSTVTTSALTGSGGSGGDITINTSNFSLADGGRLTTETAAPGPGGNIVVDSQTFLIDNDAQLSASSIGAEGGQAGDITVRTNQFDMGGSGFLFTTTEGRFDAGDIVLEIRDRATLSGTETGLFAGTESPQASGDGGNIRITGPEQISLRDGATIEANNEGTGVGGNIWLEAGGLSLAGNSTVTATTTSNQGGNITLPLQESLVLRNGSQISTEAGLAQAGGDGGDITINVAEGFVIAIPEEDSDIVAEAFAGQGGNIRIVAAGIFGLEPRSQPTPLSDVRASSELGLDGTVEIIALNPNPDQGLITLTSDLLDEPQLLAQGCEPITADSPARGAFYTSGRGGITPLMSDALGSDDVVDDLRLPEAEPAAAPITEAQGWFVRDDGVVVLTAAPLPETTHHRCWR
ncbi:MAG: filamentous hemagglutinin N-terminal domain-containing protein [Cyanobacteria bacterium P01_H01_bin.153]